MTGSSSKPSQPARASRCTREMSSQAAPAWMSTNGLVSAKPATASAAARPSARHLPHPATTTGTAAIAPGYFADAASPTASPAHSMPPLDGEREHARDRECQQHVGDGHPRVGDVRRRDRDRRCADDRRAGAVGAAAEPPRGADAAEPERDGDEPAPHRATGAPKKRLHRREQPHQQRRVVVPARVEVAVPHPPGARDDVRLVRVEDGERQPVADADEAESGCEHEDRHEGDPRVRRPEACHRRATPRRCRRR